MSTSWSGWAEWKKRCAIDLCCEEVKESLVGFVGPQLINLYKHVCPARQFPTIDSGKEEFGARTGFHFFETFMHCTSRETGKRWKDWLFERAKDNVDDPPRVAVEKLVSTTLKNSVLRMMTEGEENEDQAARGIKKRGSESQDESTDVTGSPGEEEAIEREGFRKNQGGAISLQSPIGGNDGFGEGGELLDILNDLASPDPSYEAGLHDIIEIGREEAQKYAKGMAREEKIAVLATVLGLSMGEEAVQQAAGKRSSVLYTRVNLPLQEQARLGRSFCTAQWQLFRDKIGQSWIQEDARTLDLLADAFVQALGEEILSWGKSEKSLEVLFNLEKGEPAS